jgi:cytochrome c oxidase subunit 2
MTNSRANPMITLARLLAAMLLFALGFSALAQGDAAGSNPAANETAVAEQATPAAAGTAISPYSEGMGPISRMFFPSQSSTHARETDAIMFFIFWVSVFFFVLLMGLTVYFSVKYRRRPGVPQQRSLSHNTPLELTWSIIPTLLMAVMFVWGFKVYMALHVVPAGAETINVTAQKWAWSFEYDDGSSSRQLTDPILGIQYPVYAVPIGRPVRLLMQSQDVIHSLYIPAFRHKIDVFPNRYTVYNFEATEIGSYQLFCAEYCGDQHSQMMAEIKVMSDSDYRAWRAEQSNTDDIPLPVLGETLRLTKGCAQCHTVDGTAGTGPSWKDIFGATHQFTDGTSSVVDENYLRESILYPGNKIVVGYPNQMPSYAGQLKEREIRALIAYMASLSAQGQGTLEQMIEQDEAGKEAKEPAGPDAALPTNADNALAATNPN